ncbi:alpha/beta fold hydrolase [Robertkochia aurantiaca]|uniref:alpha/beta fold hydrolase n=1 Tax=Robertkochia aurantiaca TaxID=2873700 RepID=UPI001CCE2BC2|nr:alpha/beta hydrolase [Robertkochia sp. 3YJGBD-33]
MLNYQIYKKSENAPWVTFVHGAGGSSAIWFKQVRPFSKHFNLLLVDLRGHGSTGRIKDAFDKKYTFPSIANDILEVLRHLRIESSHFVGISLGTILIRKIACEQPGIVKSMILGGAIMKLNMRSQLLMRVGMICKNVVPYLWLYKLYAFIIMPRESHKESRNLFIREAKKLYKKEFVKWFRLTSEINPLLRYLRDFDFDVPTLFVMGEEDYMFLPAIRKSIENSSLSQLKVIPECGHVVNVEKPANFNAASIDFIRRWA